MAESLSAAKKVTAIDDLSLDQKIEKKKEQDIIKEIAERKKISDKFNKSFLTSVDAGDIPERSHNFLIHDEVIHEDILVEEEEGNQLDQKQKTKNPPGFSDKYFGPTARSKFFTRYQWIDGQRKITVADNLAPTDGLTFDNESGKEFPFARTEVGADTVV